MLVAEPLVPVFKLTPSRFELKPGESINFIVEGLVMEYVPFSLCSVMFTTKWTMFYFLPVL
jgi:hypothetical protein